MPFTLFSNAFSEGGRIPDLHTCQGADLSPSLEWSGEPAGTKSFALVVEDPDAPVGTWCHWVLFDIGSGVHSLPQGIKADTIGVSGTNDFGKPGYGGPCPPKGHGPHRYFFKLYALDVPSLPAAAGIKRTALLQAMKGHVLGEAQAMGRFERK